MCVPASLFSRLVKRFKQRGCLAGYGGRRCPESGRLALKQRPSGTHATQEGDVARDAMRRAVLRGANRRAEQVQHPCRGGDPSGCAW